MKCVRCNRPLTVPALLINSRQGPLGFGPVCARKVAPVKPRQKKAEPARDRATVDWVDEVMA